MKTILVPTDYSNAGNNAMHYAAALAREAEAKLVLYNALKLPVHAANTLLTANSLSKLINENKVKLQRLAADVSKQYGIEVEPYCSVSIVAEEIIELVEKLKVDLVVMGMREGSDDFGYFGSVTAYVVEQALFPVLVIPEEVSFQGIERILFACDNNCIRPENKLPILKDIALTFQAEVEVLHVNKVKEPIEVEEAVHHEKPSGLEEILKGVGHVYRDVTDEHVLSGIEKGVRSYQADILVMIPNHTGFWDSLFNRSKTRKMALTTNVPLLSIPNPS